jgi:hypothetical protein
VALHSFGTSQGNANAQRNPQPPNEQKRHIATTTRQQEQAEWRLHSAGTLRKNRLCVRWLHVQLVPLASHSLRAVASASTSWQGRYCCHPAWKFQSRAAREHCAPTSRLHFRRCDPLLNKSNVRFPRGMGVGASLPPQRTGAVLHLRHWQVPRQATLLYLQHTMRPATASRDGAMPITY